MPLYNNPDMYRNDEPVADDGDLPSLELMEKLEGNSAKLTLEELFGEGSGDDSHLQRMLDIALLKVMYAFLNPESTYTRVEGGPRKFGAMLDPRSGRRGSVREYFLPVVDPSLDTLVLLVLKAIPKAYKFVRPDDLAPEYATLTYKWRERVCYEARRVLVFEVLSGLDAERTDMWFVEQSGRKPAGWQVSAGFMAEFTDLQRGLAGLRPRRPHFRRKRDQRPFHGRPGRDRDNGTVEGVSCGRGRHSQLR